MDGTPDKMLKIAKAVTNTLNRNQITKIIQASTKFALIKTSIA